MQDKYIVLHVIDSELGGGAERLIEDFLNHSSGKNIFRVTLAPDRRYWYFRFVFRVIGLVSLIITKSKDYDVFVHLHLTKSIYLAPLISVLPATIFITEHNTWNKRRNYALLRFYERFAYSKAKKIIAVSEAVKLSLEKWLNLPTFRDKIVVIHNGIHLERKQLTYRPILSSKCLNILVVGSLTQQKNVGLVIEALSGWNQEDWFCTIAGEGPQFLRLQNMIRCRQLTEKVFLAGYLDNIDMAYCSSDILVVSSVWEGFGLVAVEAMSHGLPVVWPNVKGIDEVLGSAPHSFKFISGNCESLRCRLDDARSLVQTSDCRNQLRDYAFDRFSLNDTVTKYRQVYGLDYG